MDTAFKALADPTRRKILGLLGERSRTVNEICDFFEITQPAISRHLAVLREAGLVRAERRGQSVEYAIDTTVVQDVVRVLMDLGTLRGPAGDAGALSGRQGKVKR